MKIHLIKSEMDGGLRIAREGREDLRLHETIIETRTGSSPLDELELVIMQFGLLRIRDENDYKEATRQGKGGARIRKILLTLFMPVAIQSLGMFLKMTEPDQKSIHDAINEVKMEAAGRLTTFTGLLKASKRNWHNPRFTKMRLTLEPIAADESEWEIDEHFFTTKITVEEGLHRLEEMQKSGEIRLCGIRRAMECIIAHPNIEKEHPLAVQASSQDPDESFCSLAVFSWCDSSGGFAEMYSLQLCDSTEPSDPSWGWLILRKKKNYRFSE